MTVWEVPHLSRGTSRISPAEPRGLPGRGWRWVAWLGGAANAAVIALFSLATEHCDELALLDGAAVGGVNVIDACFSNPIGITGLPNGEEGAVGGFLTVLFLVAIIGAFSSLAVRFRRAGRVERSQIKWVLFSLGLIVTLIALGEVATTLWGDSALEAQDWIIEVAFATFPVAIAMAIFRYRLYEIDRIISRTLSYTLVVGLLAAVFSATVSLAFLVLPAQSSLAVASSTLLVAALFNPLRRRVQDRVDRTFNRSRYNAQHVIEAFAASMRDRVDPDTVVSGWIGVVSSTMQPSSVGVWVRDP